MLNRAPIQFVLVVNLKHDQGDPREQIRRQSCDAEPGTIVRVHVNGVRVIPFGLPVPGSLDWEWYRPDLAWQFVGDGNALAAWQNYAREIVRVVK